MANNNVHELEIGGAIITTNYDANRRKSHLRHKNRVNSNYFVLDFYFYHICEAIPAIL